jgi:hypothetical protein
MYSILLSADVCQVMYTNFNLEVTELQTVIEINHTLLYLPSDNYLLQ